ncbi:hypothetical protein NHX12_022752 [Muraenolepis orangiensis]|uniref:Uncharacterized protein n=1 Tax=Muraenolepis orangiensis TaxID=630683 RepID=A0A9Q0IUD5_9TELE|nr:hypothetical protein NHX12_022752 [Muraenolepis orangiensis]
MYTTPILLPEASKAKYDEKRPDRGHIRSWDPSGGTTSVVSGSLPSPPLPSLSSPHSSARRPRCTVYCGPRQGDRRCSVPPPRDPWVVMCNVTDSRREAPVILGLPRGARQGQPPASRPIGYCVIVLAQPRSTNQALFIFLAPPTFQRNGTYDRTSPTSPLV